MAKIIAETTAGDYSITTKETAKGFETKVETFRGVLETALSKTLEEAFKAHEEVAHKYIFKAKEEDDFIDRQW